MRLFKNIRDFFFPRICICCGETLSSEEEGLCMGCLSSLPFTSLYNLPQNEMERMFWGVFPIERATSLCYYSKGGMMSDVLHGMKYHGREKLCYTMGRIMAVELKDSGFFDGIDCLIPVPLHKERLRQRGYNQSEVLASGISSCINIPLDTDSIIRTHNNVTQTHKSGFERWQNTGGLFELSERTTGLEGKHVLIIDDVLTTGATISSCIDALKGVKDIKISVATLAWTK